MEYAYSHDYRHEKQDFDGIRNTNGQLLHSVLLQGMHELFPLIHQAGRPTLSIMVNIYRGILDSIERQDYDIYSQRARVSTLKKLGIVASAWFSSRLQK